jgi:hypothetical protein
MIPLAEQSVLQELVRRESRSLLQYVGDSFPWVGSETREALARFRRIVDEDRRSVGSLAQLLARNRVPPPFLGGFPAWFTTINFVSLDYLIPQLIDAQRQAIESLERDLRELSDEKIRAHLTDVLAMKRRHLGELEKLSAAQPPAAVAV